MSQLELFRKPPAGHEFTDPVQLEEFILAGRAVFTLYSHKTTKHFTYKVKPGHGGAWYVSRLTSGEDEWIYLGEIFHWPKGFVKTRRTTPEAFMSDQFKAFYWFWNFLKMNGRIPTTLTVYHEGKCGKCGRPLTDPESVKQGYGPECRRKRFRRPPMGSQNEADSNRS